MGLLSWWKGQSPPSDSTSKPPHPPPENLSQPAEVPGLNGALLVPRPATTVTVFEFGSVSSSSDKVTLTGYCPVSDEFEPCRWEILPASDSNAPLFRVVF